MSAQPTEGGELRRPAFRFAGSRAPTSPLVIPGKAKPRPGAGEARCPPPCPSASASAPGSPVPARRSRAVREDAGGVSVHSAARTLHRVSSRFRQSRRPGPSNPRSHGSSRDVVASEPRRDWGCCLRKPARPGGYWIPAFAGMTSESGVSAFRLMSGALPLRHACPAPRCRPPSHLPPSSSLLSRAPPSLASFRARRSRDPEPARHGARPQARARTASPRLPGPGSSAFGLVREDAGNGRVPQAPAADADGFRLCLISRRETPYCEQDRTKIDLVTPTPRPLALQIDGTREAKPDAGEKGTRRGVPNRDRIRGCPRNCERRALSQCHWPFGREGGQAQ